MKEKELLKIFINHYWYQTQHFFSYTILKIFTWRNLSIFRSCPQHSWFKHFGRKLAYHSTKASASYYIHTIVVWRFLCGRTGNCQERSKMPPRLTASVLQSSKFWQKKIKGSFFFCRMSIHYKQNLTAESWVDFF